MAARFSASAPVDRASMLSPLEQAIYESVAYSDIFDYPVTIPEIRRGLTVAASLEQIEAALSAGRLLPALLASRVPYFCLAGREHAFSTRERRREASTQLWKRAWTYGRWIARLPFVRMVAVTGSMAVENAEADDDIDYMIATAPGRVWTARILTMLVVRAAALRGITLCPNYILADDVLALDQHDLYTARELAQMRPVAGHETYARLLDANAWRLELLPNATTAVVASGRAKRPLLQRALETLLRTRTGQRLEDWTYDRKAAELRREAGANDEAVFDRTMCKGHFDRHRSRTSSALAERVDAGVEVRA